MVSNYMIDINWLILAAPALLADGLRVIIVHGDRHAEKCGLFANGCACGSSEVSDPGWVWRIIRMVPCTSVSCCSHPHALILVEHMFAKLCCTANFIMRCGPLCALHLRTSVTLHDIKLLLRCTWRLSCLFFD